MVFAEFCYKNKIDIPIVVSYFKKGQKEFIFDKPIKYSELMKKYETKEKAIEYLLARCNELGAMDTSEYKQTQKISA